MIAGIDRIIISDLRVLKNEKISNVNNKSNNIDKKNGKTNEITFNLKLKTKLNIVIKNIPEININDPLNFDNNSFKG